MRDVVHTKKDGNLLFSIFIHRCMVNLHFRTVFIFLYNNDENFLNGYLIAGKVFHTDIIK